MQQFSSLLSWRLFTVQNVSGVFSPIISSSMIAVAASDFTFVSWWLLCCVRGRAGRPARPRTQHDCHHDTKVKPEAATAIIELLIMGGKTPETCWAVNNRQDNKLENCCIWLVIYLNKYPLLSSFKQSCQYQNWIIDHFPYFKERKLNFKGM
jgi:hypothetical protein